MFGNKKPEPKREDYVFKPNPAERRMSDVEVTEDQIAEYGSVKAAIEAFKMAHKGLDVFRYKDEVWRYNEATEEAERVNPVN